MITFLWVLQVIHDTQGRKDPYSVPEIILRWWQNREIFALHVENQRFYVRFTITKYSSVAKANIDSKKLDLHLKNSSLLVIISSLQVN